MRSRHKIIILVLFQITLIVASFVTIVHFESKTNLAGNLVNVAGKNRVLTGLVQIELSRHLSSDLPDDSRMTGALSALEENIAHLRSGGMSRGVEITPIPEQFGDDLAGIEKELEQYKAAVRGAADGSDAGAVADAERIGFELIEISDVLTGKLGRYVEDASDQLILLQTAFGAANVVAHVVMIAMIIRIFDSYSRAKIKDEKLLTVGEFASMIAHNMRNPLGAINNSVSLIQGGGDPETVSREMDRIRRSVRRMTHQVEGVLNYVRTAPVVLESNSIRGMLDRSLEGIAVPEDIAMVMPEKDVVILADEEKMEFVFSNIISNAIQAIGDSSGHVRISVEDREDRVLVSFENSGPDIPQKEIGRIFEPLYTTKMHGTGLGLTSCKNIIDSHDGAITVKNDPVTFIIDLPRYNR